MAYKGINPFDELYIPVKIKDWRQKLNYSNKGATMKKISNISKLKTLGIILIVLFSLTACIEVNFDSDNKVRVKGVLLENKRTIQIKDTKNYGKFNVDVHHGNIELAGGNAYNLEVEIYEKTPDDVTLTLDVGTLTCKTKSGAPFAIGSIKGTIPNDIDISIDSGAGNFQLNDFTGNNVDFDSGAGNVKFENCKVKNLTGDTGAGNVKISDLRAENIDIDTGAGNIRLTDVISRSIDCDTGVGNISATDCAAHNVYLDTGIGNISISDCQFKNKDISTGLGKIRGGKEKSEESEGKEVY